MNALYSIDAVRTLEQAALADLPTGTLMQRAGRQAATLAMSLLSDLPERKMNRKKLVWPDKKP